MAPVDTVVVVDDESVVCVTPVEGSVKEEPVQIKPDEAGPSGPAKASDDGAKPDRDDTKKEEKEDKDKEKEKVIIGMVCDTKNLYQKWDRHNRFTWTEECPQDLEEAAENEQTMKYAILVRNRKSYDSRKKLEIDSIVVQSPLLKNALAEVLKDYPGVTTRLKRLTFAAPFKPFVHRWSEFTQARDSDEYDEATKIHLRLLYDVLHEELKDVISARGDYIKNEVITYEHVWTIFQPGSTVFSTRYGRPVASRLEQGSYVEHNRYGPCFVVRADRVDFDGSKFGYDTWQQVIMPFVGTVPINELDIFPLEFHPDADAVRVKLRERGRLFERLAGYHFKSYRGQAIEQKPLGPVSASIDSRIVVDSSAYSKYSDASVRSLKPLGRVNDAAAAAASGLPPLAGHGDDDDAGYYQSDLEYYSDDEDDDAEDRRGGGRAAAAAAAAQLNDEQRLLCTPLVKGYALKPKKWLEFFVDSIGEVSFDARAFEQLVLPAGHKTMILAFAESQVRFRDSFDDDITGKGKGMIMLLTGGPGIGKTLTAEAVAEVMRVPLYVMSAGDLGVSSGDVEASLARVLDVAAKWNAVLLLDECDVFLEARSTADLDRNRIVSIFLRTLEYYEGILFLTTNRVRNMDEAFHSRIHISLEYPALDRPARRKVWKGFLDRTANIAALAAAVTAVDDYGNDDDDGLAAGGEKLARGGGSSGAVAGHSLTEEQIDRLAKLEINGRVIKNVLKTSNLLACHEGTKLGFEHLKTVLKVEGHNIE